MNILLKDVNAYIGEKFKRRDIFVTDAGVYSIGSGNKAYVMDINCGEIIEKRTDLFNTNNARVINIDNSFILPSFCDVHVHFRQPGFEYKETIRTGSLSGARGGYTSVCTMPNLKPAPVDMKSLKVQLDAIDKDAIIKVVPYGAITADQSGRGMLSKMEEMAGHVVAFSDDGLGVQKNDLMREAMLKAKELGNIIVAHCEDEELLRAGDIRGSEWKQIKRDVELAAETGCSYHVCHISTEESVQVIRDAQRSGVDVTCETAPHYLTLDDNMIESNGRFKMNPPIKTKRDRLALIEGVNDGTITIIATDHAPHSEEEKSGGFEKSLNGIVGLETAFPVLYSDLVLREEIEFNALIKCMCVNPRKRFNINDKGLTLLNLNDEFKLDSGSFLSKGHSTPFDGKTVKGEVLATILNGEVIYEKR